MLHETKLQMKRIPITEDQFHVFYGNPCNFERHNVHILDAFHFDVVGQSGGFGRWHEGRAGVSTAFKLETAAIPVVARPRGVAGSSRADTAGRRNATGQAHP